MRPYVSVEDEQADPVEAFQSNKRKTANILVIDDDPSCRRFIQRMLESRGYSVATAASGRTGIAQAQDESPDLILLDLVLPDCNGFSAMQKLKSQPKTNCIPVIIVTGRCDPESLLETAAAGQHARAFLWKP